MRIELELRGLQDDYRTDHPTVVVKATIQEGDMVTAGSQFSEEFSLEALKDFLGEVRDDQSRGVDAKKNDDGVETGDPLTFEQANEMAIEDQKQEDANELSEELNPESADGPKENDDDNDESKPKSRRKGSRK